METNYNLTLVQKRPDRNFNFYINLIDHEDSSKYFSSIFNIPRLPLIGSKILNHDNKNSSHIFGKILSLICFQIDICQGEEKNEIEHDFKDFVLPSNLDEYLNIDEVIEIDNNTDEPENNLFFMPKKKLNFYLIFTDLPKNEEKKEENEIKNEIKNEINIDDEAEEDNLNKINIIDEEKDSNKFDKYYYNNSKNFKRAFKLFNIIPHFFYINDDEKSLLEIKNRNFQRQITLYNISDKNYYDIDIDQYKKKEFIDINNLRAESSDIILNENNKFIIKDNLKFYLNIKNDISQFYLIYTYHENEYHSVFYYITCNNDKSKNKMEKILNESQNIKEIIEKMENTFDNKQVISNLKGLFKK